MTPDRQINDCIAYFNGEMGRNLLFVSLPEQRLYLFKSRQLQKDYSVSTSARGAGCKNGSYQTPYGLHEIKEKIGSGADAGEVFTARKPQGRRMHIEQGAVNTGVDAITSRILWLSGLEPGVNRGRDMDSYKRYIYIHGTHEEGLIGQPVSMGCIRMTNKDVIELFDEVSEGDYVYIMDESNE